MGMLGIQGQVEHNERIIMHTTEDEKLKPYLRNGKDISKETRDKTEKTTSSHVVLPDTVVGILFIVFLVIGLILLGVTITLYMKDYSDNLCLGLFLGSAGTLGVAILLGFIWKKIRL